MVTHRPIGSDAARQAPASRLAALAAASVGAVAFALLTWNVVADVGLARADPSVQTFVVAHRVGWMSDAFKAMTWLGSTLVLTPVAAVAGVLILRRRRDWLEALLPGLALLVTVLAKNGAKIWIGRPRPDPAFAIVSSTGSAFPSGHSADSLAAYAMVALTLSLMVGAHRRWWIWLAASVVIVVVGTSRVYLGAHWLTDVLGGWALAAAIVSLLVTISGRPRVEPGTDDGSELRPPAGPVRT